MNQRIHIVIRGAVQGVGFRPFIYRLAKEMDLPGWVSNSAQGVFIEVEGPKERLDEFVLRIEKEKPPRSFIQSLEFSYLDPMGFESFVIRESETNGVKKAFVLPDIATCPDCLAEIFDPSNRRYRYPFTNCTNCGPRFTIIESLPYDRPNTSMKNFSMCPECRKEYTDPMDRRFHAQPNACPICGPHLELWDEDGGILDTADDALLKAAEAIRDGKIVALKGIGGFQLLVDARNDEAVTRLRDRKHREEKPFALMYPTLKDAQSECTASELEERILLSPESPIVLLQRKTHNPQFAIHNLQSEICNPRFPIAPSVAPRNPYLGVMLPYTPLHHLLMRDLGFPVVATSGNLSDEPICIEEHEALKRLGGIADCFLVHDRPIVWHVDDSILRILLGRELVLRRARGYAPLPLTIVTSLHRPLLAVGAHLKNTVALNVENNIFVSQHIGDLETQESLHAFQRVIHDFRRLYDVEPKTVICDLHPDYLSTQYARQSGLDTVGIQHHYAHVAACMAENQLDGELLGVSWDGTGFGVDGTVWGGEFLLTNASSFERVASFRTFPLPGGDRAIKEPRRSALGMLYELFGLAAFDREAIAGSFTKPEVRLLRQMLEGGVNSPRTSSVGRIFDAVASLLGIRQRLGFEGQAAMELEFAATNVDIKDRYEFKLHPAESLLVIDWSPTLEGLLADIENRIPTTIISAKFHNTLAASILSVAQATGQDRVVLTGGCFQNKLLTERTVALLTRNGIRPYWHQRIPPNDGGIAPGQLYAFARQQRSVPIANQIAERVA
jgi:hydrogenase maturation protein HypF